ncbi:phosphofructokinase family protein [Mycobacterium xenopi 4042]|uniref:Phosphofructokinase family protein n=1 Tax=Mycobacterium xenopi 4042 TaxID=1299334 RepID=X7Z5D9_MYCXE|nr:phosphofructokinase family protein [Mycobacterium xenopi 4042]
MNAGLASGAHMTLIPEQPFDVEEVCRLVKSRFQRGTRTSSAWSPKAPNRSLGR